MAASSDIPLPILFNPVKHHRDYIMEILTGTTPASFSDLLEPLCNNYVDIYTGMLTPGNIGKAVISILRSTGALHPEDFAGWVATRKGYRLITLQDGSEWVIRESADSERYVHIHPARTGPFTERYKGSTLKTVYLLGCGRKDVPVPLTLEMVNEVRLNAGLSPVKSLERSKGILSCYAKIFHPDQKE